MITILGIDAAWTARQPSGVALVQGSLKCGWHCLCVAPSYQSFIQASQGADVAWDKTKHRGCEPDIPNLLSAARALTNGKATNLAAIDMPLSHAPITTRREADNAVSRSFGAQGCGTHSPTSERPGRLGADLTADFLKAGYPVIAADKPAGTLPGILEVYPHPALLALLHKEYRVPYKASKSRKYWPEAKGVSQRIDRLLEVYKEMLEALSREISDICIPLPTDPDSCTLASLKEFEDSLDALVCAWVGCLYIEDRAKAYGNETAAIWIPC